MRQDAEPSTEFFRRCTDDVGFVDLFRSDLLDVPCQFTDFGIQRRPKALTPVAYLTDMRSNIPCIRAVSHSLLHETSRRGYINDFHLSRLRTIDAVAIDVV